MGKITDTLRKKKIVHDDKVITTNKYYDDETLTQIIRSFRTLKKTKPDQYFYFMLLVYTGARRAEVCLAQGSDFQNGNVTMDSVKGGNRRSLPLPKPFYDDLVEWSKGKEYLFHHTPWWYSQLMRKHVPPSKNVIKRPVHGLRHSMALRLLKRTGDVRLVQQYLGQRDIRATLRYCEALSIKDRTKELRNIHTETLGDI